MNIIVALARLSVRGAAQADRTGLIEAIGPDQVLFLSVEEAVRKLGPGASGSSRGVSLGNEMLVSVQ